jgi:hypothetical protein
MLPELACVELLPVHSLTSPLWRRDARVVDAPLAQFELGCHLVTGGVNPCG